MALARFILLLLSLLLLAGASFAQDEVPAEEPAPTGEQVKAAELKKQGDAAMFDLRYDDALSFYQQAYALDPNPALLYNQSRAHQARGRYPEALAMIERFSAEAPDELKARVPRLAELTEELRDKTSMLAVTCNVDGAKVVVRDVKLGATPLSPTRVNAGKATIRVSAEDHVPVIKNVVLPGGGVLSLPIELESISRSTVLAVKSPVAGASVWVDGKPVGAAPAELVVAAGKHTITVRHPDHEDATRTAVVDPGARKEVSVDLVPLPEVYETWWFWTGIGVVAAGATVFAIAATTQGPTAPGSIAPGTVQAPLISWWTYRSASISAASTACAKASRTCRVSQRLASRSSHALCVSMMTERIAGLCSTKIRCAGS